MTVGSDQKISCEPLPWCTSKSTIATFSRPCCFWAWRVAIATLLNRQKPMGRAVSAWWPGGRTATKALAAFLPITSSMAATAPPAPRSAAAKLPDDMVVSASRRTKPWWGVAASISFI